MSRRSQNVLLFMSALALTGLSGAWAQQAETQTKQAAAPPTGAAAVGGSGGIRGEIPGQNDVLATVVDGNLSEAVTKGELIRFLARYQLPEDEDRQEVYSGAMERLINTKLLTMFLARQKIPVSAEKVDEQIERLKQDLKKDGQDLGIASSRTTFHSTTFARNTRTGSVGRNISPRMRPRRRSGGIRASTATSSAARRSGRATS